MSGYTVHIRRNATGEVRTKRVDSTWNEAEEYTWSEGNWACDCNRGMFFFVANSEADMAVCGSSEFDVVRIMLDDGTDVALEFT